MWLELVCMPLWVVLAKGTRATVGTRVDYSGRYEVESWFKVGDSVSYFFVDIVVCLLCVSIL